MKDFVRLYNTAIWKYRRESGYFDNWEMQTIWTHNVECSLFGPSPTEMTFAFHIFWFITDINVFAFHIHISRMPEVCFRNLGVRKLPSKVSLLSKLAYSALWSYVKVGRCIRMWYSRPNRQTGNLDFIRKFIFYSVNDEKIFKKILKWGKVMLKCCTCGGISGIRSECFLYVWCIRWCNTITITIKFD